MNIFVTDPCPIQSARNLPDKHSRPRKEIEDEVLAIELKIRKDSLGLIDGGKS